MAHLAHIAMYKFLGPDGVVSDTEVLAAMKSAI